MPTRVTVNSKRIQKKATTLMRGALLGNKKLSEDMALAVTDQIRKGVKPRLKPFTIEKRKELSGFNKTGKGYRAKKSNLTFTGRFLKSFKGKFLKGEGGIGLIFSVGPRGTHPGYKLGKGRKAGKSPGLTNQELAEKQLKMGRDYKKAGLKARGKIIRLVKKALKRALR